MTFTEVGDISSSIWKTITVLRAPLILSLLSFGQASKKRISLAVVFSMIRQRSSKVEANQNKNTSAQSRLGEHGPLRTKQVSLNLPPFRQRQTQFSAQDVLQTKTIAKVRIHVERAIRRIKEFHLFDSDISLSTLGSVNQLYTVACLLTNFQGALIKDTDNTD